MGEGTVIVVLAPSIILSGGIPIAIADKFFKGSYALSFTIALNSKVIRAALGISSVVKEFTINSEF